MSNYGPYEVHPFADKFPLMEGEEFEALVDSIRKGFDPRHKIVLDDDQKMIIEGRNRYRACTIAKVEPQFMTLPEAGLPNAEEIDVVNFIIRENITRRHLNTAQRAALALDYLPILAEDAKRRMLLGKTTLASGDARVKREGKASEQAAKLCQVSGASVERMKAIKESQDKELEAKVMAGKVSLEKGAAIARKGGNSKRSQDKMRALEKNRPDLAALVHRGEASMSDAYSKMQWDKKDGGKKPAFQPAPSKLTENAAVELAELLRSQDASVETLITWLESCNCEQIIAVLRYGTAEAALKRPIKQALEAVRAEYGSYAFQQAAIKMAGEGGMTLEQLGKKVDRERAKKSRAEKAKPNGVEHA